MNKLFNPLNEQIEVVRIKNTPIDQKLYEDVSSNIIFNNNLNENIDVDFFDTDFLLEEIEFINEAWTVKNIYKKAYKYAKRATINKYTGAASALSFSLGWFFGGILGGVIASYVGKTLAKDVNRDKINKVLSEVTSDIESVNLLNKMKKILSNKKLSPEDKKELKVLRKQFKDRVSQIVKTSKFEYSVSHA